ncbi:gamma-glutamyltransferase [Sulfitobacter sp. M57]|uniref:gamma-glutamyltransferase n=1 Tax=unclassified Sulfitobacter TaxID=196795 RepID=UPI0023E2FE00|nr:MULTISPECIES: gamma-glutamyltransferase [unclassified Sulfitobacter]MDF3413215.1 gamma-glutamyltransferase [Sulfitobacter sp. KE5]MDF3421502.1 gamma-glutamyltransferase [Sulfitobacter sp. KE43]MDF3431764.1 gamma-glutamyltransferase [Sulfitobacter sp. KE42]MDF3457404.1 gamma-glutamyltransferase [Sulfitobacter sp. S74]MDF3461307.1 gamma-glutamyltransferase [Sulfitobacter sp. Ks18]
MQVSKTVIETEFGVVAAQHRVAAEAGAAVLAAGGDAVDAAIATSFAIGVVEPWMSGPAGGGGLMLWRADEGRAHALNYGMRSPAALDPKDFPLSSDGTSDDLFPWDAVEGERNVQGATAVAVPGLVDGMGKMHARFGTMPWADLLAPAIRLAREGLLVDWFAALNIASSTRVLAQDPDAAALFLEDGQWPTVSGWTALADKRLDMSAMARSLQEIADQGARAMYDGDLARMLAQDVQAKGGSLSADDLHSYHAFFSDPLSFEYRGTQFDVLPGLTAGPTMRDALAVMATRDLGDTPDGAAYGAYADGLNAAYAARLSTMGHDGETRGNEGCTTHFSVVDKQGNMVSQTQTLLSIFGSRVVSPSTGFLLNNGIMWFDPVQGRPNSLAPDKPCLMNVCPALGSKGENRFAFGASGGRKIVSAVTQLASFVADFDMDLADTFHQPRIDVSGGDTIVADETLPDTVINALRDKQPVVTTKRTIFPYAFACPAGVMRRAGKNSGCTEIMSPWGDAIMENKEPA